MGFFWTKTANGAKVAIFGNFSGDLTKNRLETLDDGEKECIPLANFDP